MARYWQLIERYAGVTSQTGEVISLPCYQLVAVDGNGTVGPFHVEQTAIDWANERWESMSLSMSPPVTRCWVDETDRPYGLPTELAEQQLTKVHHVAVDGELRVSRFNGKTMEWIKP